MAKKNLSILKKPLLITTGIGIVATGTVFYLNKKQPGLILGVTTQAKDTITGTIPQSKSLLDKMIPEKNDELLMETEESNSDTELEAENKFLKESLEMTQKQLETLKEKGLEVKDHLVNLSEEIKESSSSTPIHEKAFEYGQYVYCQQVVKEYENN